MTVNDTFLSSILSEDDINLSTREMKRMVGNPSDMTIWRWRHDRKDPFPEPIVVNNRNYWPLCKVRQWIARRAKAPA